MVQPSKTFSQRHWHQQKKLNSTQKCTEDRVFESATALTPIFVFLWDLSWSLHTKALSHDPAPEGPRPVLHPKMSPLHWPMSDATCLCPLKQFLRPPPPQVLFLLLSVSLVLFYSFLFRPFSVPPSHNLLKTFPPSRSWTPFSPPLTDPPSLAHSTGQHSVRERCLPFQRERRVIVCFQFHVWLWYVVHCVHPAMMWRMLCGAVGLRARMIIKTAPDQPKINK